MEEEHRMPEPNLRHVHIPPQQPKKVNLKLPRPRRDSQKIYISKMNFIPI